MTRISTSDRSRRRPEKAAGADPRIGPREAERRPETERRTAERRETERREEARRLDAEILAAIDRGWRRPLTDGEFDRLARRLFEHQARWNPVARAWWSAGGHLPAPRRWLEIRPLPVAACRTSRVAAFPVAGRPPRFLSSGTTRRGRSRVFVEDVRLYDAALLQAFRRHCLTERDRMRLLFLAPPPSRAPRSSLAHMFRILRARAGGPGSAFLARAPEHVAEALRAAARRAVADGEPVFLLGPTFAFVHALEELRARGERCELPAGSRLFQTGGFKGRSREATPAELEEAYARVLGIPPERVVNEYGMAELASQFYAGRDRRYEAPPWVRWTVLNPLTLEPAANGEPGLLAVWDLANRSNCLALRTEDLAVVRGSRLELLGRAAETEPRGCSLEAEARALAASTGRRSSVDAPRR